jgi:hypothetical protein
VIFYCDASLALLLLLTMSISLHVTMSHGRRLWVARIAAGLRRLVAVFCAVAFLSVGMAHALNNCDGLGVASQATVSDNSADQPIGTPGDAVPCDHCYGCTGAVALLSYTSAVVGNALTDLVISTVAAPQPYAPGFHTPPPKSLT